MTSLLNCFISFSTKYQNLQNKIHLFTIPLVHLMWEEMHCVLKYFLERYLLIKVQIFNLMFHIQNMFTFIFIGIFSIHKNLNYSLTFPHVFFRSSRKDVKFLVHNYNYNMYRSLFCAIFCAKKLVGTVAHPSEKKMKNGK